jgi:hypothetical protein
LPRWMTIGLWLLSPLTSSCSAPPSSRSFEASAERLRAAARAALADWPELREDAEGLSTGWSREAACGEQGLFLGNEVRRRVRHEVAISDSILVVRSRVESRAPGGPRSIRWQRVDPRPAEEALLGAVARALGSEARP